MIRGEFIKDQQRQHRSMEQFKQRAEEEAARKRARGDARLMRGEQSSDDSGASGEDDEQAEIERRKRIESQARKSVISRQYDVLQYLRRKERDQWATQEELLDTVGVDILQDKELFQNLSTHPQLEWNGNTLRFRAPKVARNIQDLRNLIQTDKNPYGLAYDDIKDVYPGAVADLRKLESDGTIAVLEHQYQHTLVVFFLGEAPPPISEALRSQWNNLDTPLHQEVRQQLIAAKLPVATADVAKVVVDNARMRKKKRRAEKTDKPVHFRTNAHMDFAQSNA